MNECMIHFFDNLTKDIFRLIRTAEGNFLSFTIKSFHAIVKQDRESND